MAKDTEAWGRDQARSRYSGGGNMASVEPSKRAVERGGGSKSDGMSYPGTGDCYPQKLGDESNLQAPNYDNDVASDWRRGMGSKQAEGKPGFCPTPTGPIRGAK